MYIIVTKEQKPRMFILQEFNDADAPVFRQFFNASYDWWFVSEKDLVIMKNCGIVFINSEGV